MFQLGDILLNKYQIEALVGRGGFAEVYRATHLGLNVPRALKVLRKDTPGLGSSDFHMFEERFQLEAQLGAHFDHPNIVKVHDFERLGEVLILVMEYCPEGSLAERLAKAKQLGEQLPMDEVLQIVLDVAKALSELHKRDIVHRDLKPSNILLDRWGRAKVADLGLAQTPQSRYARLGQGSLSVDHPGTIEYMPPEQRRGEKDPVRASADVYALGCVLFETLTGRMAYHQKPGTRPRDLRADVPEWLDELVKRMLSEEAKDRPWDGKEAEKLLKERLLAEETNSEALSNGDSSSKMPAVSAKPPAEHLNTGKTHSAMWSLPLFGAVVVGVVVFFAVMVNKERRSTAADLLRQGTQVFETQQSFYATATATSLSTATRKPTAVSTSTATTKPTAAATTTATTESTATVFPKTIVDKKGVKMALVPAGGFQMGSENGSDDEKPDHSVYLDAFYIDIYEVTNAMYEKCVQAGVCQTPYSNKSHTRDSYYENSAYADYPVIHVDWQQANRYCTWRNGRLPTEAEWEKAARGGLEGKLYPWGDELPNCTIGAINGVNFKGCGLEDTMAVGSFAANGYGLFDMAGNVLEWVSDWYAKDYYRASPSSSPSGPNNGSSKVIRGGCWSDYFSLRIADRNYGYPKPTTHHNYLGFRCAAPPGK